MRHLLQQHGLRLVRQHDAPKLGTLEFGDGRRPGRRDREERIRREEIEAEAAGVADAGPYADRNDRREDSAAAIEDETGEKHAGQQQEISRLPGLHLERHLQHGAPHHDTCGDAVPDRDWKPVLQNQRVEPVHRIQIARILPLRYSCTVRP